MKGHVLRKIAECVGGELIGDPDVVITGVKAVEEAEIGDISIVFESKSFDKIAACRASALIVSPENPTPDRNLIRVQNPREALIGLLHLFYPKPERRPEIHDRAVVSEKAVLGPRVSVGAGAFIAAGVTLGADVEIHPNVYVGEGCDIGDGSEIFPNVTLYAGTRIGKRVRIHAGTVIGSDGFGYMRLASGAQEKIPQVGTVEIGDDVEIGANCTIDRATLGVTRILSGTKIDNLVQIGHNCRIGEHCCIVAQVGISGSVELGNYCVLAGQVGISDHVKLEDGAIVGAKSGVMRDLGPGRWLGIPALPLKHALQAYHLFTRFPELRKQVAAMEKRLNDLEKHPERHEGKKQD